MHSIWLVSLWAALSVLYMIENTNFQKLYIFNFCCTYAMHLKYTLWKPFLNWTLCLSPSPTTSPGRGQCFGKGIQMRKSEFIHFSGCLEILALCLAALSARFSCWPRARGILNVVLSLGPSMVVRIVLVLILSTSSVVQKNAKSTLRTSEPSSASSETPTLNTRIANTIGYPMNILTVSRHALFSCNVDLKVQTVGTKTLDSWFPLNKLENLLIITLS